MRIKSGIETGCGRLCWGIPYDGPMKIIVWGLLLSASIGMAQYRRGVNVSGAEFGQSSLPGTFGRDYTFNSEGTFRYFGQKSLGLIRLPLQWERLQQAPSSPLDSAYLAGVKSDVAWAKAHGDEVILDVHNFGRYSFSSNGSLQTYVIDNKGADGTVKVSGADLADLWVRLSNEFKFERAVFAYDLMNEPHDMGKANWKAISQTVLSAIRANQDDKLILIPGDSWSSANRWASANGPASWINDPANNFAYEAHQYFDSDESGTYVLSYDAELAKNSGLPDVGKTRVSHFIGWCQANQVRGIVDEYGIPDTDSRWEAVLDNFLGALDAAGMDGAYWAAGEWWGSYPLSVQPLDNFTVDRPQMATLQAHLGGEFLTALSAASLSVARAAPGTLVTLYGNGFTDQTAQQGPPYSQALADIAVTVTDASGASAPASLLYVSPGQINLQIPPGLAATGKAGISVMRSGSIVSAGAIQLDSTAPAIFTTNAEGYGLPVAQIIRIKPDGSQTVEPVNGPVDLGADSDRVLLTLFGTGVRAEQASAQIGGSMVPVILSGLDESPGVDQIVVELPRSLAGAGSVSVVVNCDGIVANAVTVTIL